MRKSPDRFLTHLIAAKPRATASAGVVVVDGRCFNVATDVIVEWVRNNDGTRTEIGRYPCTTETRLGVLLGLLA